MSGFDWKTALGDVAPIISGIVGTVNPLAGLALSKLSQLVLGHPDGSENDVHAAIMQGLPPQTVLAIKQADDDMKVKLATLAQTAQQGQIDTNKAEAASTNWFVAGWRPYIGWICGTAIGYQFLFQPITNGIIDAVWKVKPFISIDATALYPLVLGMLGLGTQRMVEKIKGVQNNH